jgi:2',3'-cyclic-nucleotide 2'-phosphodiesterase (5'-nucleotidase family)
MSSRNRGAGLGPVAISALCSFALLASGCALATPTPAPTPMPAPITITIAHTNDVAGYLEPCG